MIAKLNESDYKKFQYPEAPDAKLYTGAHKPLISKELFDIVQETRGVYKGVWAQRPSPSLDYPDISSSHIKM